MAAARAMRLLRKNLQSTILAVHLASLFPGEGHPRTGKMVGEGTASANWSEEQWAGGQVSDLLAIGGREQKARRFNRVRRLGLGFLFAPTGSLSAARTSATL